MHAWGWLRQTIYHIRQNIRGGKLSRFIGFIHNVGKTFTVLLSKNKKNFHGLLKSAKLFPLECFVVCGSSSPCINCKWKRLEVWELKSISRTQQSPTRELSWKLSQQKQNVTITQGSEGRKSAPQEPANNNRRGVGTTGARGTGPLHLQ